ncbi:MAG: sodium/proton-translocating pyrophosphatase, partial [Saprospiraceae bacterium]|nr:sodium/proton-translocating pyrophosphatase [Saprospiraceae bacterium]
MSSLVYFLPIFGVIGLVYMFLLQQWVTKQDAGDEKMQGIAKNIADGAMAFLKSEYRILAIYVLIASVLLGWLSTQVETSHPLIVIAFIIGAAFSVLAGFFGMRIATKANVRTTQAARTSLSQALKVSFNGGSVMGLGVAGLAVLGLSGLFALFYMFFMDGAYGEGGARMMTQVLEVLAGFSVGAESIALFARVGGGIYTKAADVGADLVGKVEAGIPEDDPRNPATIADNVGDNVGDVAGMGADLFGSYVATVLAAMVLGNSVIRDSGGIQDVFGGIGPILLPIVIAGVGILLSIVGMWLIRIKDNDNQNVDSVQGALDRGNWASIILTAIVAYPIIRWMLPETMTMSFFGTGTREITSTSVFNATMIG